MRCVDQKRAEMRPRQKIEHHTPAYLVSCIHAALGHLTAATHHMPVRDWGGTCDFGTHANITPPAVTHMLVEVTLLHLVGEVWSSCLAHWAGSSWGLLACCLFSASHAHMAAMKHLGCGSGTCHVNMCLKLLAG